MSLISNNNFFPCHFSWKMITFICDLKCYHSHEQNIFSKYYKWYQNVCYNTVKKKIYNIIKLSSRGCVGDLLYESEAHMEEEEEEVILMTLH